MEFKVRYIRRDTKQPAECVMHGPDERAVGWAVVQRGDQLISVGRNISTPPALPQPPLKAAPKQPPNGMLVYPIVVALMAVGTLMACANMRDFWSARRAYAVALDERMQAERKLGPLPHGTSYSETSRNYLAPKQRAEYEAGQQWLVPIAYCLLGLSFLGGSFLLAYRQRRATQQWADLTARIQPSRA